MSNDDLIDLLIKNAAVFGRRAGPRGEAALAPPVQLDQDTFMGKRGEGQRGIDVASVVKPGSAPTTPYHTTESGLLFEGDCLDYLTRFNADLVDTVFADPPFNLGKVYGNRTHDARADAEYVEWCRSWLKECVRVLTPGGALFVYNLPKWSILLGAYPDGAARDAVPSFDCDRDQELSTDPWTTVPRALQPALFHQGKAQDVSQDPDSDRNMPALRR